MWLIENKNKLFELKSFALIKFFQDWEYYSQKINLFDKIFIQEKENSNWWIEIRKFWNSKIKFPTNAENSCFLIAKDLQRFFAKKNWWKKPKSIIILIEKNIPINSWLWWAFSNAFEVFKFLNNFWELDLCQEKFFEIYEK